MEDIMRSPYDPCQESIVNYETKSLRDTRQLLKSASLQDVFQFIDENTHPRLWRLLAEQSLLQGNMFIANKAFTRCSDFYGIQLVKQLQLLGAGIKEARTAAYLRKFDEAEKLYLVANRLDLAMGLRAQLGDWFKVERYIPDSTSCSLTSKEALHNIGNYYFERRRWIKAAGYYLRAGNLKKQLECFYAVEDFVEFVRLLPNFHEGCRELSDIGVQLGSVGLCKDAVFAFLRGKNIKKANIVCSLLGDWGQAAVLAKHHDFIKIDVYAQHLLQNEMVVDTMQFYRRANKPKDFFFLTRQLARSRNSRRLNPLFVKKLYVFIAHEAAQNQSQTTDYEETLKQPRPSDDIWQCAEAHHFWLLAHRQLHSGQYEYATRTSLALQGSKEPPDSADLYSFIALTSYFTRHYGNCSKAMTKLGPIIKVSRQKFNSFVDITTTVFLRHPPIEFATYLGFSNRVSSICVASGREIEVTDSVKFCTCCGRQGIAGELQNCLACPLCHSRY